MHCWAASTVSKRTKPYPLQQVDGYEEEDGHTMGDRTIDN